jgi:aconitase B
MAEKIDNKSDEIYTYLNFDQLTDYNENKVIEITPVS